MLKRLGFADIIAIAVRGRATNGPPDWAWVAIRFETLIQKGKYEEMAGSPRN